MKNEEIAGLVEKVLQNKEENFQELYEEIGKTVFYLSYKILNNKEDAEDAAQEAIFYIYRHMDEVRELKAFNQWMKRVVFSICIPMTKKKKVVSLEEKEEDTTTVDDGNRPEEMVIENEHKVYLLNTIDELPDKQKSVLLLYYYQNLTAIEISKVVGCSLSAVKNRLFKGRRALARALKPVGSMKSDKLFSVNAAGISLVSLLLREEADEVFTKEVSDEIWNGFEAKKVHATDGLNPKMEDIKSSNSKSHYRKYIIGAVCAGFVGIMIYTTAHKEEITPNKDTLPLAFNKQATGDETGFPKEVKETLESKETPEEEDKVVVPKELEKGNELPEQIVNEAVLEFGRDDKITSGKAKIEMGSELREQYAQLKKSKESETYVSDSYVIAGMQAPRTKDISNIGIMSIMFSLSALGLLGSTIYYHKRKLKKK